MAYQLNGNVVIDDNGQGLFNNLPIILKPSVVSPTSNETVYGDTTLQITDYSEVYGRQGKFVQFQVANVTSFASANLVYESGNIAVANSNVVSSSFLETSETYYFRARYVSNTDVFSSYSDTSCFVYGGLYPPPDGLGCPYLGGYFTGNVDIGGGVCYHLIVAPNATGCALGCCWKTSTTLTPGTTSSTNGFTNTCPNLENGTHPAGNWAATRSIDSYDDWYLPANSELYTMYTNQGCMPAGEDYYCGQSQAYWSSTESEGGTSALSIDFTSGAASPNVRFKTDTGRVRAIRRVPIT